MKKLNCYHFVLSISILTILTTVSFPAMSAGLLALQYGARAFANAPRGLNYLGFTYGNTDINIGINGKMIKNANVEAEVFGIGYGKHFDFYGKDASIMVSLPYASLSKSITSTSGTTIASFSKEGVGDPYFHFVTPIYGGDSVSKKEFLQTEPKFVANLYFGVIAPLGSYDSSSTVNIGNNRWEFRFGMPLSYTIGKPGKQISFELFPVVFLFDDNDDFFGGRTLSQDPVFHIEGHITRDITPRLWASLDLTYLTGGKTEVNGLSNDDEIEYTGISTTFGMRISRKTMASVTFSRELSGKPYALDGNYLKIKLGYTF